MVFVKVRETYDLATVKNKMTVIGIHTPKPDIIKYNFPGLLLQCKAYRPVSCDVRLAAASVLPLDPLGVGTSSGDVAPEDVFNPILYKAISNVGMSQLEARLASINGGSLTPTGSDVVGDSVLVDVDTFLDAADDFPYYYGLLADAHGWRHASVQSGLEMNNLKPVVFEALYNMGDNFTQTSGGLASGAQSALPAPSDVTATMGAASAAVQVIRGNSKPLPFMNCTAYTAGTSSAAGFPTAPTNIETNVPWINALVGVIVMPPSRLHQMFFRMVCEWTIEFSAIRSALEISTWGSLGGIGNALHYQNYSYESTKKAIVGEDVPEIMTNEACMVSSNVDITKVM